MTSEWMINRLRSPLRRRPPRHTTSNLLGASPYLREAVAAARLQDYASWTTGCHWSTALGRDLL